MKKKVSQLTGPRERYFSAVYKNVPTSPTKARRTLKQLSGKRYDVALKILTYSPYLFDKFILKTALSAAANARNAGYKDEKKLYIKSAYVDKGIVLKRAKLRAKYRSYRILKSRSHLTIILQYLER
jgi:large subunit ribosomal protein L22